jgi:hypothetical protein
MSRHSAPPTSRMSLWIVIAMLAMVAVPAAITLNAVHTPATLQISTDNPTPYGYTWSLLLFIVPVAVIALWFLPQESIKLPKDSFWTTIAVLVPLGWGLDFFFAHRFFTFQNTGATLGWRAPALGSPVPIEEYVFYLSGFLAVLLLYVWLDEFWIAAYNIPDYAPTARLIPRLLRFHPESAIAAVALVVAALIYKKLFAHDHDGFPAYFTFIVVVALAPSASFLPTVRPFINWRAFSLTMFVILLISLLWEATLAVPYNWWNFQERQLIGFHIHAWAGLPIEEVCLWIGVTCATVIVYEAIKIWRASGKPARHAFLGPPKNAPTRVPHDQRK